MAGDLASVRESICGSKVFGQYPGTTDVDHVLGLCSLLARMKETAGVTAPLTGTTEPPVKATPKTVLEELRAQTGERWQAREDKRWRTVAEAWDQVRLDLAVLSDVVPTPGPAPKPPLTPAPATGWKTLPVFTSSQITGEHSSYQSGAPRFASDGMHVALPAKGAGPGVVNPVDSGEHIQRVEAWLAGWTNLTGRQYLRYDFTLLPGFPVDTTTWQAIAQLKNSSTGSPPLEIMVNRGQVNLQWHDKGGRETGREVLGKATTGVRHSVILDVTFSSSGGPNVTGWFDGKQAFGPLSHGPTMYPGQSIYGKVGTYRDSSIGKASEVVFHGVAKGSTFAAVTL